MSDTAISILLVEDNQADAALLRIEFAESSFGPFAITHVMRLAEALSILAQQAFDVVVSDLGLPDSQGLETLRGIQKGRPPGTPIVIITALADEAMRTRVLHEGADDYLIKGMADSVRSVRYTVERRRANELSRALESRNTELEAANRELESFSYSVSHDLRAPLRTLDGFSQALLEDYGGKLDEQGREHLHRIRAASQRMGQLIDDLLNLSRVTRGEMNRDRVDLSKIAREVVEDLARLDPGREVKVVIGEQVLADADAPLVRALLTNLFGNAWKFSSKRSPAHIEFGVRRENGDDTYFVRDNGAGFNMKYAGKLFGAFQRLHAASEFPGTGVGLATVQRIAHRHGGRAWAESAPGNGATFYFTLQPPAHCAA